METLANIGSILLLVVGFGFVIFWHELGHFLAAKAVGIRVEQFAVGFGQAMVCWRKGIGTTVGTSAKLAENLRKTGRTDISETEYRLNWIPLGGYVKMLGQDDMDANATSADPRAFNNKSVAARMLVVSAGVIMNVLLAALIFMGLYMYGHNVPAALVGSVLPGSPAQVAGIEVGDRIISIDGKAIPDFTMIQLNIALGNEGDTLPVVVRREGKEITLQLTPRKATSDAREFLAIGVGGTPSLRGLPAGATLSVDKPELHVLPDQLALLPGDVITAIAGNPITPEVRGRTDIPSQYAQLHRALQASDGRPVELTVRDATGAERRHAIRPWMIGSFGGGEFDLAGILPRPAIGGIQKGSDAIGKLFPGDIVLSLTFDDTHDLVNVRSTTELRAAMTKAGADARRVSLSVSRNGQTVLVPGLLPNISLGEGKRGLGVSMLADVHSPYVGGVKPGSSLATAGVQPGSLIVSVAGKPVENLFDVRRELLASAGAAPLTTVLNGVETTHTLALTPAELTVLRSLRSDHMLALDERIEPRKTSNPLTAAAWGVGDTRDFILQGYVTIQRIVQGSVSATNLTGPIGIFHFGGKIATEKPIDWMFWFLAMISANLAVVNFLPIPIVDGGLFVFLILEKIRGKPLSQRSQGIAQIVGLCLILSLFVFVTYNDIARLLT